MTDDSAVTVSPAFIEAYRRVTGSDDTSLSAPVAALSDRALCEAIARVQFEILQAEERAAAN